MKLLAEWTIQHGGAARKIELLHGDLSRIPPEHEVDLLVVSAFPNDYTETYTSLIGALSRIGLSVRILAENKLADLRTQYSCWLSHSVNPKFNFRHLLCIESGWRGTPPEITDDLFRAIAPYLLTDFPNGSLAMPLIWTGDQEWPADEIFRSVLQAAAGWLQRGLPLQVMKIVVYQEILAQEMRRVFIPVRDGYQDVAKKVLTGKPPEDSLDYDVFLSYSHHDSEMADLFEREFCKSYPREPAIFRDKSSLREGSTWLMKIARALDSALRVVTIYSPDYWESKNCQNEFLGAFMRQTDTGQNILFPVCVSDANIPYMFRTLQYSDCRIYDQDKFANACSRLAKELAGQSSPRRRPL